MMGGDLLYAFFIFYSIAVGGFTKVCRSRLGINRGLPADLEAEGNNT